LLPPAASAASRPVYRDPPSYHGIKRAPSTATPAPPNTVALSGTGAFPDALVDEAGTAHIVWNEGRGDDADATMYCRLKRGEDRCDTTATLTWDKSYGSGDGPQFNTDNSGPKIVRVGDQLVALSLRYPTVGAKPDGASSGTLVAWTSNDGGTTWSQPAIVGKRNLGQLVVIGPPDDPTILNLGVDPLCDAPGPAALCVEAYRSGQYSKDAGNLATGRDQNYAPGLALDRGTPVSAAEDLSFNTFVRRWSGVGSPVNPATWGPATAIPGDQTTIAGGPAGVFMMSKPPAGGPFDVRPLVAQPDGTMAGGQPSVVTGADGIFARLAEDPAGRLHAAWQQRAGKVGVLVRSTSTAAAGAKAHAAAANSFSSPQLMTDGANNGQIALDATDDGGGFVALNHTGGVNSPGQIVAAGFGSQGPTGKLGLGDIPGPAASAGDSCQQVKFGSFTVDAAAGCFLHGTGKNARTVVTGGEVNIDGVRIVPDDGAKLVIDPKTLRIDTVGGLARAIVSNSSTGDIVLWHGEIHRDLSKVVPGSNLFEFPIGDFKANILGFDLGSDIPVKLEADGVHIPIDLKLPAVFGGFSGHAELVADAKTGLHLTSVHIHIGPVALGAILINNIDLDYMGVGDIWRGDGKVTVPAGGALQAHAEFDMGEFNGATISFTPATPIPIGPFVYLLTIKGGFETRPAVHINAGATIGAGAAVQGVSPVNVVGNFDMTFPSVGPATFKLSGSVNVFLFGIGDGFLRFQTDGYADFGGHTGLSFGPLSVNAMMEGFVDGATGRFGADLNGEISLCLKVGPFHPCGSAGSDAAVSNVGFAACAHLNPPDPVGQISGGVRFPWADFNPAQLVNPVLLSAALITHVHVPCNTNGYRVPPPRAKARAAQAAGSTLVAVPGKMSSETVLVEGDGGAPHVTVTGPGGATVDSAQPSAAGYGVSPDGMNATYVVLNRPAAGDWTVTPASDSAPVKSVMQADAYTPATVSAKLGGRGRARTIAYKVAGAGNGQQVAFIERGSFGTHQIGSVANARGTLRFRPAGSRGGRRTVVALIERDGFVTGRKTIGHYVAPGPPKPAAVRGLKARRNGHSLAVSWRGAPGAARYEVRLRGGRGTAVAKLLAGQQHAAKFTGIRGDEKLTVDVRALSSTLTGGPHRSVKVPAARH
jgi:hypothetical protein